MCLCRHEAQKEAGSSLHPTISASCSKSILLPWWLQAFLTGRRDLSFFSQELFTLSALLEQLGLGSSSLALILRDLELLPSCYRCGGGCVCSLCLKCQPGVAEASLAVLVSYPARVYRDHLAAAGATQEDALS